MESIDEIIQFEGGYIHRPLKDGGPIKFGITKLVYANYLGREVSNSDLRNMDIDTAKEIYIRHYVSTPRIDTLDSALQSTMIKISLQHGPFKSISKLQHILNQAGFGPITIDGVLGPRTREAADIAHTKMDNSLLEALMI